MAIYSRVHAILLIVRPMEFVTAHGAIWGRGVSSGGSGGIGGGSGSEYCGKHLMNFGAQTGLRKDRGSDNGERDMADDWEEWKGIMQRHCN
jgi:hypothetical protein